MHHTCLTFVLTPCPISTPEWCTNTEPSLKTDTPAQCPSTKGKNRVGMMDRPRLRHTCAALNASTAARLASYPLDAWARVHASAST